MHFNHAPHQCDCGLDWHARPMSGGILHHAGESVVPRNRPASPEALRTPLAPERAPRGIAVACLFTWYWLAARGARAPRPLLLAPALDLRALHGGKAPPDRLAAQHSAVLRRGGLVPQASGSPAARRAPRAVRRRRRPRMRQRAELWRPGQQPHRQDKRPESGPKRASTPHRSRRPPKPRGGPRPARLRGRAGAGLGVGQRHHSPTARGPPPGRAPAGPGPGPEPQGRALG